MKSNKKVRGIGKYGITMSMMFLSLLLFTLYFTTLGSLTASGSDYNQCISVEVLAGDTVWEIARDINRTYLNQKEDVRLIVFAISQENQLIDYFIYPGQKLIVPISGY